MSDAEDYNFEQNFDNGELSGEFIYGREPEQGEQNFEMEEPRYEATFAEMQQKQVYGEQLDARSQKDKPFLLLRDALLRLGQDPKFIDDTIVQLRPSKVFPFLNATYVANAKVFYASGNIVDSASIKRWVTEVNKRFGKDYLDDVNFFRYLTICKKLFEN